MIHVSNSNYCCVGNCLVDELPDASTAAEKAAVGGKKGAGGSDVIPTGGAISP